VKTVSGGNVTTGEREIEPAQAQVVERIFQDFIAGVSPKQIAKNLNREGVPGPSAARGVRARSTGTPSVEPES
jgi:site-specific DNA recombinase